MAIEVTKITLTLKVESSHSDQARGNAVTEEIVSLLHQSTNPGHAGSPEALKTIRGTAMLALRDVMEMTLAHGLVAKRSTSERKDWTDDGQ